ncbi:MAG: strawberry notch family protein [Bacteroidales bacterium]|jgi:hypothetical protein|nr:strawberry notch family protein [Bacteroidales bacterium]
MKKMNSTILRGDKIDFEAELGAPYIPTTETCNVLNVSTPDSMEFEIHIAARKIKQKVGNFGEYVCEKLKYTKEELCRSLSAEQTDAIALSIYNIEEKKQAMIVGDQTGIGKGRIAAAMIRYAVKQGKKPIFLSEKPNLFSDLYRDLVDIGSDDLVPFIVNAKDAKTKVKDNYGNVVHEAPAKPVQERILNNRKLSRDYDFVMATYSQFNQPEKKPMKPMFLSAMAEDNILVMDEAHNAAGSSQTGAFMQEVLRKSKGVIYLSATFAKRPDNMPIYAMKTCLNEANMTDEDMINAIQKGGIALQEIISSQLVSEGQMVRRERTYEGIEVNYFTLAENRKKHRQISDTITDVLRRIIEFQENFIKPVVGEMDKIAAAQGKEVQERKGTSKAGVDNQPYFSKVFNVINQLLFSVKAKEVAEHAIKRLKEGKKPVIAFSSTMGSFLEELASEGEQINGDFALVLRKGIESVLKYSVVDVDGQRSKEMIKVAELGEDALAEYNDIINTINQTTSGISISPIDYLTQRIESAGFSVAEVTGRKLRVKFTEKDGGLTTIGIVENRKKLPANDAFRMFNNNEYDVLLINQAGSTGASAHAIPTDNVPADQVKQRVMIVLQPELDINREIQKRGRINRTGQIILPIYDYMSSDIPAEQRLMMMLKRKLKSLDANTTSNQKSGDDIMQSNDFLNKYGDKIVTEYLIEEPEFADALDDPLNFKSTNENMNVLENAASKVTGRVAVLSTAEQEKFYNAMIERYQDYVRFLIDKGEYDLEMEAMNLEAETLETKVLIAGKGGDTDFGKDTILEKCDCNNIRKPYTQEELRAELFKSLNNANPEDLKEELRAKHKQFMLDKYEQEKLLLQQKYAKLIKNIANEKKYKKLEKSGEKELYIKSRTDELNAALIDDDKKTQEKLNNIFSYLDGFFKFFYIGRAIKYPTINLSAGVNTKTWGVFLGFHIDERKSSPFAPSAVKARFAIADSNRYMALTCSGDQGALIQQIVGISYNEDWYSTNIVSEWSELVKNGTSDRIVRYIITGNILQGAGNGGKLIDYTLKGGGTKKGILMSEGWSPDSGSSKANSEVVVPIIKALKYIKSLREGQTVKTENSIGFTRSYLGYQIIMPKNRAYKAIFTDADILKLIDSDDGFNMQSGNMVGSIVWGNIETLINILQQKYSLSVKIPRTIFDMYFEKDTQSDNVNQIDKAEKRAMEMYEADKKKFPARVKNKVVFGKKQNTNNTDNLKLKLKLQKAKLALLNI